MITVGEDTYVTVDDATKYITDHYPSTDARVKAWEDIAETDKEIFLRHACESLSRLPFRGVTYEAFQPLPFPRFMGNNYVMAYRILIAPEAYLYPEMTKVPDDIIAAQIEEAFELGCPSDDTKKSNIKNGVVQSYSIGHFSENYNLADADSVESVLKSGKAQKLVGDYVGGAYEIC